MFARTGVAVLTACGLLAVAPAWGQSAWAQEQAPANVAARRAPLLPMNAGDALLPAAASIVTDSATVEAVLAANPGREMVICLAGCAGGHGSILWQRNRTRFVETVDGAGGLNLLRGSIGRAREPADAATEVVHQAEAVICLAGCNGPVGLVVWRGMRLAWIRDESKADLMAALRKLGDRLAAQDAAAMRTQSSVAAPRAWVAAQAKDGLLAAFGAPAPRPAQVAVMPDAPRS